MASEGPPDEEGLGEGPVIRPALRPAMKAAPLRAKPRAAAPSSKTDPFVPRPVLPPESPASDDDEPFAAKPTMTIVRASQVVAPSAPLPLSALKTVARATEPLDPPLPPTPSRLMEPLDPPLPPKPSPRITEPLDPPLPPAPRRPPSAVALDPPLAPQTGTAKGERLDPSVAPKSGAPSTTAPTRSRRAVAAAAGVVVAFVVVLSLVRGPQGPPAYDAADADALGAAWRAHTEAAILDKAVLAHVTRTFETVARAMTTAMKGHTALPAAEPRLVVVAHPTPRAFSLPDGTFVLSDATLGLLRSDAELAALIAHSLAHHRLGHVAAHTPRLIPNVAVAVTETPHRQAIAAAAQDEVTVHEIQAEIEADRVAVRALKVASWDARALAGVLEALANTPWRARHADGAGRVAAIDAAVAERLAGSNLLQNDTGKTNEVDYREQVLEPLARAAQKRPPAQQ